MHQTAAAALLLLLLLLGQCQVSMALQAAAVRVMREVRWNCLMASNWGLVTSSFTVCWWGELQCTT
jgi:hypothetical protein